MSSSAPARAQGAQRRDDILRIAMETFATRGYHNASLAEIAERSGLTQAGVLHHFRTKAGLLTGVLELRDKSDIEALGDGRPRGLGMLRHLVDTARLNAERAGIVRLYTVLSAESVTEGHPAQEYFRGRYTGLRAIVVAALREAVDAGAVAPTLPVESVANGIIAVMDGLQVQWLLDPGAVDMVETTERVITALIGVRLPPEG
ncbi:transcriptional regulator, TetR family [Streptomyces zhaozhouensis]|uniref:Transcriptional regulator, TetR family n=1 Tax=Streptomyces zhaozhouensis TaxID=1300267 RepID=A0A286DPS3_9ACTN|nr:TetR/AcrR family transcriptional regulator [Streptomyces zhaozhouensis]SOD60678.1 transcriptional regulator, TetR family [Streptomyces zhaozhouensis]